MDPYQVLKNPMITEKGTMLSSSEKDKKYIFRVAAEANKLQIKKAVEDVYKVKVSSVNTLMMHGKKRRVRHKLGRTPDWKKAVITLKGDAEIDLT
ncbi:MAG: 50S ribosomal protein L23 [Candidatus Omnitrophica bacterium]|nr:50S ribosomal protein L23 [Candidatus Omnitrophota bacterium]